MNMLLDGHMLDRKGRGGGLVLAPKEMEDALSMVSTCGSEETSITIIRKRLILCKSLYWEKYYIYPCT